MPDPQTLPESLQEAILAVLAFHTDKGALISAQVLPEHFDGLYHEIAAPVLAYRARYGKPPGRTHLEDLFARAKLDPSDRKTHALRRTLVNLAATSETVNAEYVVSRTQDFVRSQKLKAALLDANERYMQGGDEVVADVEAILNGALRFRQTTLDSGTFLSQYEKSSAFRVREEGGVSLGIQALDRLKIGLAPKQMLLYISPKNTGKSWMCVHAGRQSLIQKEFVLHVSLEMDEPEVLDRYYQSFFGIATLPEPYTKAFLEFDELERLTGFKTRKSKPRLDFGDPTIKAYLRKKVKHWGTRFDRLVIKAFPSGTLTIAQLESYLDYLELVEKFIPTVLIVDYPDLGKVGGDDFRLALGRYFVDLRGVLAKRNLAGFFPTQSGRASIGAQRVSSTDVTEDISKVFTADTVLSYSQTAAEAKLGLARLSVEHARYAPKGTLVLLAQSYPTGQYVTQSAALVNNLYFDKLKETSGEG